MLFSQLICSRTRVNLNSNQNMQKEKAKQAEFLKSCFNGESQKVIWRSVLLDNSPFFLEEKKEK